MNGICKNYSNFFYGMVLAKLMWKLFSTNEGELRVGWVLDDGLVNGHLNELRNIFVSTKSQVGISNFWKFQGFQFSPKMVKVCWIEQWLAIRLGCTTQQTISVTDRRHLWVWKRFDLERPRQSDGNILSNARVRNSYRRYLQRWRVSWHKWSKPCLAS